MYINTGTYIKGIVQCSGMQWRKKVGVRLVVHVVPEKSFYHTLLRSAVGSSRDVYTFALAGLPLRVQGSRRCDPEPPLAGTEY